MYYPLPPCLVQAQQDHETPWPNSTKEGMQKVSLQFFLLLMFAEVIHINWNLAWRMHASILKWLINQLKPLNRILKIQRHAMQVACTDFRADTQPHTHYSPLRHHRGSSEQVCNTNIGFQERNSCRVAAACPKWLQAPAASLQALGCSGSLPWTASLWRFTQRQFRISLRRALMQEAGATWAILAPPRWTRPRSLLAPWESGKWQSAGPKRW